jgi:outer membrane lipoprotein SlyB
MAEYTRDLFIKMRGLCSVLSRKNSMHVSRLLATIALILTLVGCATRPSNLAGVEVQDVREVEICDETDGTAGFIGGAVGQAAGKSFDKDTGGIVGSLLGYYIGMKIGCETSKRPGQILMVRDSSGQVSELTNDARKNGFFKVGDRVSYEAESRWSDLASNKPWIKKVQP